MNPAAPHGVAISDAFARENVRFLTEVDEVWPPLARKPVPIPDPSLADVSLWTFMVEVVLFDAADFHRLVRQASALKAAEPEVWARLRFSAQLLRFYDPQSSSSADQGKPRLLSLSTSLTPRGGES